MAGESPARGTPEAPTATRRHEAAEGSVDAVDPAIRLDLVEIVIFDTDGVEAGRRGGFALVVGVDRGGRRGALYTRGAGVVVADLAALGVVRRTR